MDGVLLQQKIYGGYAKSALRVGLPFDLYRPVGTSNPMAAGNKITTLKAAFAGHSAPQFNFGRPSDYKDPLFHALIDGTQVQRGDYLASSATVEGPFYVASMDPVVPILVVQTNRTVTVYRPDGAASKPIGVSGYAGTVASTANANETAIMTAWPASVLEGARGINQGNLPGDAGIGIWRIKLPYAGVLITQGSIVIDDLGKRMVVRQAELSDLGWNLQAVQALV
jgi:hypothetical protein